MLIQPLPYRLNTPAEMLRRHIIRKMENSLSAYPVIYRPYALFCIQHAERRTALQKPLAKLIVADFSDTLIPHPRKIRIHLPDLRAYLTRRDRIVREKLFERRLCRRTEKRRAAVVLHKLGDRPQTRSEKSDPKHLRLIEDNDTVGYVVEFPAGRCSVREKRLEELHIRCDDDRLVPVLARELCGGALTVLVRSEVSRAVVAENVFRSEYVLEYRDCLFYDADIRYHVNYTLHAVLFQMSERERHR